MKYYLSLFSLLLAFTCIPSSLADDGFGEFDEALEAVTETSREQLAAQKKAAKAQREADAAADPVMASFDDALDDFDASQPKPVAPPAAPIEYDSGDELFDSFDAALEDVAPSTAHTATNAGEAAGAAAAGLAQLFVTAIADAFSTEDDNSQAAVDDRNRLKFDYIELVQQFGLTAEQERAFYDHLAEYESAMNSASDPSESEKALRALLGEERFGRFVTYRRSLQDGP